MKRIILAIVLLTACGGSAAPPGAEPAVQADEGASASVQESAGPCTVPVPPNTGEWKRVDATGISFCVPSAWRVTATRASYSGGTIRWQVGSGGRLPFTVVGVRGGMSSTSIANGGASSAGTNISRRTSASEMIGGQMASLWNEEGNGRVGTGVSFRDPPLNFTGDASGQANVQLQFAVYRTIRFIR